MTIETLLLTMGIPSAITGLAIWWLKKYIDKKEARAEEHDKNLETLMMMVVQTSKANNVLAIATAHAVQRIPDAQCNGDMTAALEKASQIQQAEKDFLVAQGIKHIFTE